ncbi:DUF3906 family protein [Cytobacillus sp. IB215665]|uniref:DUF3906 family protein n=1 Tax=Cytobacillus sp. IB215665 TaxID=3097357 RepID=UPI002A17F8E4|nr:DUF3906 family protein [Cytobacillus sp. IB215665]MDX8365813.1 DUF3906 family protein [Cytobacillus sp. IB215665]
MNLYKFEVKINEEVVDVVIASKSDDEAFHYVEIELEKHFLSMPDIDDITLYEKKIIRNGSGFVLA